MLQDALNKNWDFVKKNYDSLLKTYRFKYILVDHEHVVGSFDSYATAANEGVSNFGINSGFLVQLISDKEPLNIVATALL